MLRSTKTFLNFLFLLFSVAGFAAIFYCEDIEYEFAFLIPTGLTMLYGLIIGGAVSRTYDYNLAEHQIDSIYFMGFLYTLMSLATLFYKLNGAIAVEFGEAAINSALYYVGISVTTSVAGVLFRNMARGRYLKNHPEDQEGLEKSYELLKSIADNFATSYKDTFETIKLYLDERTHTAATVNSKEKEYLKALDTFITATERFSRNLSAMESRLAERTTEYAKTLAAQTSTIKEMSESGLQLYSITNRIRGEIEALPIEKVNQDLVQFRTETGELSAVLDSLIEIVERKITRVS